MEDSVYYSNYIEYLDCKIINTESTKFLQLPLIQVYCKPWSSPCYSPSTFIPIFPSEGHLFPFFSISLPMHCLLTALKSFLLTKIYCICFISVHNSMWTFNLFCSKVIAISNRKKFFMRSEEATRSWIG